MADNKPVDTGEKTVTGRTIWNDPETGEDYSERSTTFEIDGKFYTMPTVSEDGRQHTEDQIRNYVKENGPIDYLTGEELPEFRYIEDAIEYAISRSSTRKQTDMAQGGAIPMNNQMELFGDGGLKDEGGTIDEVSGNEVPVGGTKEGVRDDIPANVSEGEFIFPADVVRFVGLDKLMQIRQDAKMGLKKMDAMGQMGNSDEATMDDDIPFGMADLMVVSSDDTPMEFAGGGFVPVQNFYHGGVAHNDNVLDTADVPTTDTTEVIDYDAYMDSVVTEIKEYRNEAGEKINITFINGVAFPPIPVGFTLYVPADAEAPTEESEIAAVINNNNDDDNKGSNRTPSLQPINYAGMSNEDFAKRMEYENTTGYQVQKNIGLAISAMVPFGLGLAYGSVRSHARASEERLNAMIKGAKTPEEAARLSGIRDGVLKNASLKSTEESTAIAKWVDGWLVGKGYNPNLAAAGSNFVNNVNSQGILPESSIETGANNAAPNSNNDSAATQNSFLPKETVQSEEYFEDKLTENREISKDRYVNAIIERLKPGGGDSELAGLKFTVPVDRGEIAAVRKHLESEAFIEESENASGEFEDASGAFVGGQKITGTKAVDRLNNFNTLVEGATAEGRTIDSDMSDGYFVGPNDSRYEESKRYAYNQKNKSNIIPVSYVDGQELFYHKDLRSANSATKNTMPEDQIDYSGSDDMGEDFRITSNKFRNLNPTQEAKDKFYDSMNTISAFDLEEGEDNYFTSEQKKNKKDAERYYKSGAGRDGSTSIVAPRTIKSYEGANSDMSGLDQLAKERFASAQNAYNAPEVPASVADSSRMLKINQPLGGGQQETFNQAFNRNRLAGVKVFTHTDGKVYSTKTVEERNAEIANTRPNTGFQDLANLLTKDDGRSYTGGILRNEAGDRVNSAYQNAANALTPGDGKVYKDGILKNKAGATVNSFYQNAANNLTPNDGRSYVNGVLLDDKTKEPYVEKPSDDINSVQYGYTGSGVNDVAIGKISDGTTSGVLADKDGKVIRDDNNRTVYVDKSGKQYVKTDIFGMSTQAPTGTIATQKEDDGQSKQADPVVKVSVRPTTREDKADENRQKQKNKKQADKIAKDFQKEYDSGDQSQDYDFGFGFNKGGLASKPKVKKTKTTKKRGLAARK